MMAEQDPVPNGDDTFERDLKEILDDGPDLNDTSNTVQGGTPKKIISMSFSGSTGNVGSYGNSSQPQLTRSFTMPPATSNVPLANQQRTQSQGDFIPKTVASAQSKLESVKNWSLNTYKCTKQFLSERLGKGSKTVDLELEAHIEVLRDMQRKYSNILRLSRALTNHFYNVVQTQRALGEAFGEQSLRSPELIEEFSYNCETQRALVKNGEILLGAMNFFTSSLNTLANKTMEDTLITVKNYEHARLEFDAYRNDMEALQLGPKDGISAQKLDESKKKFEGQKAKFEQLRSDVQIKLKFLDENRVKVMHKQLLLFHNAVSAYFTGNDSALEATLKQFNIKVKAPNAEKASWLEQ